MLDYRIETFLTLCETLNYTRTAEALNITQPGVTQHIQMLEQQYGCPLFSKIGRKVSLTPSGELLREAMLAFRNDEKALGEMMRSASGAHRQMHIGVTLTIGEFVITKPLAAYLAKHPDESIHVTIANTSELLRKLDEGTIQFAVVEGYFDREVYSHVRYRTERFIAVCAKGHRFKGPHAKIDDLLDERLLIREPGSGTREILERSLSARNLSVSDFPNQFEINSMYAILQVLREDGGISFLYEAAARQDIEHGTLAEIALEDFQMHHDFTFIWNKGSVFGNDYIRICREIANVDECMSRENAQTGNMDAPEAAMKGRSVRGS